MPSRTAAPFPRRLGREMRRMAGVEVANRWTSAAVIDDQDFMRPVSISEIVGNCLKVGKDSISFVMRWNHN